MKTAIVESLIKTIALGPQAPQSTSRVVKVALARLALSALNLCSFRVFNSEWNARIWTYQKQSMSEPQFAAVIYSIHTGTPESWAPVVQPPAPPRPKVIMGGVPLHLQPFSPPRKHGQYAAIIEQVEVALAKARIVPAAE